MTAEAAVPVPPGKAVGEPWLCQVTGQLVLLKQCWRIRVDGMEKPRLSLARRPRRSGWLPPGRSWNHEHVLGRVDSGLIVGSVHVEIEPRGKGVLRRLAAPSGISLWILAALRFGELPERYRDLGCLAVRTWLPVRTEQPEA